MKLYLNELTDDELKKVWDKNSKLQEKVENDIYEDNMEMQYEDGNMFFSDEARKYFRIEDNYSSFYFRLTDGYKLMENLDLSDLEQYNIVTKQQISEYKKYKKYYYQCSYYSDRSNYWLDKIEELAKKILYEIERYLHEYENVDYSDAFNYFVDRIDIYEDYYITSTDDYIAYSDFTRCYA
jgi:hypothetical protein